MVQPVLQYGVSPALKLLDALSRYGELHCVRNDARACRVRVSGAEIPRVGIPRAQDAESRARFFAATNPYKTGTRCCTAIRRYTRYPACPTDEIAKVPQSQATTGRLA